MINVTQDGQGQKMYEREKVVTFERRGERRSPLG
jgi:hypothetical protein